jgi:hypothetical protein
MGASAPVELTVTPTEGVRPAVSAGGGLLDGADRSPGSRSERAADGFPAAQGAASTAPDPRSAPSARACIAPLISRNASPLAPAEKEGPRGRVAAMPALPPRLALLRLLPRRWLPSGPGRGGGTGLARALPIPLPPAAAVEAGAPVPPLRAGPVRGDTRELSGDPAATRASEDSDDMEGLGLSAGLPEPEALPRSALSDGTERRAAAAASAVPVPPSPPAIVDGVPGPGRSPAVPAEAAANAAEADAAMELSEPNEPPRDRVRVRTLKKRSESASKSTASRDVSLAIASARRRSCASR